MFCTVSWKLINTTTKYKFIMIFIFKKYIPLAGLWDAGIVLKLREGCSDAKMFKILLLVYLLDQPTPFHPLPHTDPKSQPFSSGNLRLPQLHIIFTTVNVMTIVFSCSVTLCNWIKAIFSDLSYNVLILFTILTVIVVLHFFKYLYLIKELC